MAATGPSRAGSAETRPGRHRTGEGPLPPEAGSAVPRAGGPEPRSPRPRRSLLRPHRSVKTTRGVDSHFDPSAIHTSITARPQAGQRLAAPPPGARWRTGDRCRGGSIHVKWMSLFLEETCRAASFATPRLRGFFLGSVIRDSRSPGWVPGRRGCSYSRGGCAVQVRSCWTSVLARTRSFRITAVRATFGGFPLPTSASYLRFEVGIVLDRDQSGHVEQPADPVPAALDEAASLPVSGLPG